MEDREDIEHLLNYDPMYIELNNIERYEKINIGDEVKYNKKFVDLSNAINYLGWSFNYDIGTVIDKKHDDTDYYVLVRNTYRQDPPHTENPWQQIYVNIPEWINVNGITTKEEVEKQNRKEEEKKKEDTKSSLLEEVENQ